MLVVGATCTLKITFTPSATGGWSAFLVVDGINDEEGFVNVGGTGTNDLLFKAYGLGPEVVLPDRRADLLAGVDATIATGFYPFPTVTAAMSRGAHLIPIDGPVAEQLRREYPFVRQVTIPADTYPGQPTDIATLGVERLLIASSRLDEGLVHDLTRVFIETLPEMAASMHTSIRLTNVELASATPIPLHAGAAQYYRERELTR